MTQKPLGKKAVFDAKKAKPANRHGKVIKQRKGAPWLRHTARTPPPTVLTPTHHVTVPTQGALSSRTARRRKRTQLSVRRSAA